MTRLSEDEFAMLVRNAPLVAVDLILRDPAGLAFVARRNNKPAQGFYFVPGGSIRKDEPIASAFQRILKAETGLETPFSSARLLGTYDHIYAENRFGQESFSTHYVTLGHELVFAERPAIRLDGQHGDCAWLSPGEILASSEVHENTKAYFRDRSQTP